MKKNELKNGDITVCQNGSPGVVIIKEDCGYILFSDGGCEDLENYTEDMTYEYPEGEDDICDIMQVYRENGEICFSDYKDGDLVFERDPDWVNPREASECRCEETVKGNYSENSSLISVVVQGFYGNRTGTDLHKSEIGEFLSGHTSGPSDIAVVRIPDSDGIVLVYSKHREKKYLERKERLLSEENYRTKPLACVAESGIEIYSRCIACRMAYNGEFESLREGDFNVLEKYLAL